MKDEKAKEVNIDKLVEDIAKMLKQAYGFRDSKTKSCENYTGEDFSSPTHLSCKDAFKKESIEHYGSTLLKTALMVCTRVGDQVARDAILTEGGRALQKLVDKVEAREAGARKALQKKESDIIEY